jgi:hypothetical protein
MGANVELDIFLKKERLSLKHIFLLLEMQGLHANIRKINIFDDWCYTNQRNLGPDAIERDLDALFLEKFTRTSFIINNTWRCTLITSFEDAYLDLSFGINTDDFTQNKVNNKEDHIALLYDKITDIIIDNVKEPPLKELFLVASMGLEYSVAFHSDIMMMLTDDENGVARWILPKDIGKHIVLKNFIKEEKMDDVVFTRL